jgi:hypothetical protein
MINVHCVLSLIFGLNFFKIEGAHKIVSPYDRAGSFLLTNASLRSWKRIIYLTSGMLFNYVNRNELIIGVPYFVCQPDRLFYIFLDHTAAVLKNMAFVFNFFFTI